MMMIQTVVRFDSPDILSTNWFIYEWSRIPPRAIEIGWVVMEQRNQEKKKKKNKLINDNQLKWYILILECL